VYHGPREPVADFFAQQGFVCPPRKGVADFLQEVTSSKDQEVCRLLTSVSEIQIDLDAQTACVATIAQRQNAISCSACELPLLAAMCTTSLQMPSRSPVFSQQYWANQLEPHQYVSVPEFAARFQGSRVGRAILHRLARPAPCAHITARFHTGHDVRFATSLLGAFRHIS